MANDGQIVFEVTADGKHAIADIKEITRAIEAETGKWDKAAKQSTDNIGNGFSDMLKKLAAGFSAVKIGKALLDIGSAAVEAASDLEEVQNVVDTTFGQNAGQIESWAKTAQTQFGLTETQAKRFSSTMGAMLKSSGLAGEQIVDVSTDLAGLAADMASFYNLDFDEAFSKIRSGISGQTMPLKELGIDMSVATLNAFALQQGLDKTFDKMSQGEQTMLRYQYLMSATADAQGDFARTSDGYANSMRTLETNLNSIKTKIGEFILPGVTDAVNALNGFLETLTGTNTTKTVLDDFVDIDEKTQAKIEEIHKVQEEANALAGVLDDLFGKKNEETGEIEGGKATADTLAKLGVKSDEAQAYLQSLGFSTEEINEKQQTWLDTCKQLVKTIPGLNEIINTETGEVKGGTQAVYDYIKAWEEGQVKLAMLGALQEKESALASRFSDLPGLQLDMALASRKVRQQADKIRELYKKYGIREDILPVGSTLKTTEGYYKSLPIEYMREINGAVMELDELKKAEDEATNKYQEQADALAEAKISLEEYRQTIEEMPGDVKNAVSESEKWWQDNAQTISTFVENAKTSLQALSDHVQGVRESVEKSVDKTIGGFEKIKTPVMEASEKTKDLTNKLAKLGKRTKKNAKEWDKLNEEINKSNSKAFTAQNVGANLKQQAEYMETYLANLRKARALGFSNEVLAQLSDGSEDSYDVLEQLAKASPNQVEEINKNYQTVIDKKKELTNELTGQQLTVDQTYKALADKAKQAVAELDLEELAGENAGKTVKGAAEGIKSHLSEVTDAVDAIIAEINRLAGVGVNVDFDGFGGLSLATTGGSSETDSGSSAVVKDRRKRRGGYVEGSFASGINYVPRDMNARIHEGETILNAQEASFYRAIKNGAINGVDMETLGGVMRDNVRPGGNVYLDGKIVGSVISDRQGRAYKSLQRSGWQS